MAMNGTLSEHEYGIQVLLCVYVKESPSGETPENAPNTSVKSI